MRNPVKTKRDTHSELQRNKLRPAAVTLEIMCGTGSMFHPLDKNKDSIFRTPVEQTRLVQPVSAKYPEMSKQQHL